MSVALTDDEKRAFIGEHIRYRKQAIEIASETFHVIQFIRTITPGSEYRIELGELSLKFLSNDYSDAFSIIGNPIIEYGLIACRQLAKLLGININYKDPIGQDLLSVSFKKSPNFVDSEIKLNDLLSVNEPTISDYRTITQTTRDTFDVPLHMLLSIANEASAHLTVNTEREKLKRPFNNIYPAFAPIIKLIDHYICFTFSLKSVTGSPLITVKLDYPLQVGTIVKVAADNYIIKAVIYIDTYTADVDVEIVHL